MHRTERFINEFPPMFDILPGWGEFGAKITAFPIEDRTDIFMAYDIAYAAHKGQYRKSGEPYYLHPRTVALILLDVGIRDSDIIVAALLHDVVEDTDYLDKGPRDFAGRVDFDRIQGAFNHRVERMVQNLTMFNSWGLDDNPDKAYLNGLRNSDSETLLIKMADRLHNIRTLTAMPLKKQRKKIQETKTKYLPIFQLALYDYPREAGLLLQQLSAAIKEWESSDKLDKTAMI